MFDADAEWRGREENMGERCSRAIEAMSAARQSGDDRRADRSFMLVSRQGSSAAARGSLA